MSGFGHTARYENKDEKIKNELVRQQRNAIIAVLRELAMLANAANFAVRDAVTFENCINKELSPDKQKQIKQSALDLDVNDRPRVMPAAIPINGIEFLKSDAKEIWTEEYILKVARDVERSKAVECQSFAAYLYANLISKLDPKIRVQLVAHTPEQQAQMLQPLHQLQLLQSLQLVQWLKSHLHTNDDME